jgi:2,3-dihydroxybenzoate-AMP ligase
MVRTGVVRWPREFEDRYVDAGYWQGTSLGAWPGEWASAYGERVALVDGATRISYSQLAARCEVLAVRLLEAGLKSGDNIVMQLPNCWEFVALFFACQRIGVAPALTLPQHRDHEIGQIAQRVGARAIAVPDTWRHYDHQALAARVGARLQWPVRVLVAGAAVTSGSLDLRAMLDPGAGRCRERLDPIGADPRDAAFFLLSGGTTGVPKLIARTHDDYGYSVRCTAEVCGSRGDDVFLAVLPAAHGLTLGGPGVLGTLAHGGRVVFAPSPEPARAFGMIARERVTRTAVTPAVAHRWLRAAADGEPDLSSLRILQIGGAPLAPEVAARIEPVLGCALQQVFGMSEGLHCFGRLHDPPEVVIGTQGRPMSPADEVRVVDERGRQVGVGEVGELLARGPCVIRGYYADPDADARAFAPGGWYRTGDLVRQDSRGNISVRGRVKDIINRGGEKISAEEVEDLLRTLPQVEQLSVISVPDAELGERVCVCVVLRPGHSLALAQVREACQRSGLAAYKVPEVLAPLDALPLTPVGKVDKNMLRDRVMHATTKEGTADERR